MKLDLLEHIQKKNYIKNDEPVVIALSGGIDSMVLFHLLYQITNNVIIAHVNHNKRNESLVEYKEIEQMAIHKNVAFEGLTLEDMDGNFHEESRNRRFDFFIHVAKKHNATKVFLAHHADDQLETILMRITRGSSFTGYAGIKEKRIFKDIAFIRPLLDIDKSQIINYAKENNISYFEDSSNQSDDYTRNRFRHHIIPLLRNENESLTQKILQYSDYLSMTDKFLAQETDDFLTLHFKQNKVDLAVFNNLNDILKIKVLKYLINLFSDNQVEVSYQQYKDMIELLKSENPNISYNIKSGFSLFKVYNQFYIGKDIENEYINLEIISVGEYIIPNKAKYIFSDKKLDINHTDYIELWYNDTVFPLYLRNRQDGDKMRLAVGTKKIKDIFIDQKVSKFIRDDLVVLANDENVLWIPRIKKSFQDKNLLKQLYIYEVI